jgi:F0F1-type ATP synthase membrane subunit b/b'
MYQMTEKIAQDLISLKRQAPGITESLLKYIAGLRESARDAGENAQSDSDRLVAATQARTYRDLLNIFDEAKAIVEAMEKKARQDNPRQEGTRDGTFY